MKIQNYDPKIWVCWCDGREEHLTMPDWVCKYVDQWLDEEEERRTQDEEDKDD